MHPPTFSFYIIQNWKYFWVILEQLILPSYTAGIVSGVATSVLVAVRDGGQVNVMNLEEFVEVVLGGRYATSIL